MPGTGNCPALPGETGWQQVLRRTLGASDPEVPFLAAQPGDMLFLQNLILPIFLRWQQGGQDRGGRQQEAAGGGGQGAHWEDPGRVWQNSKPCEVTLSPQVIFGAPQPPSARGACALVWDEATVQVPGGRLARPGGPCSQHSCAANILSSVCKPTVRVHVCGTRVG